MKLLNKLKVQIAKMAANLKNSLLFSLMSGNSRDRCRAVAYDGLPTRVIAWLTDNPASTGLNVLDRPVEPGDDRAMGVN